MVGVVRLQRTNEYLTTLQTELHVIQNAIDDSIKSQSLSRLDDCLDDFDRHGRNLKQSSRDIEWTDAQERDEYIANLETELEEVKQALHKLVDGSDKPEYDQIEEHLQELQTRTHGLLEDV